MPRAISSFPHLHHQRLARCLNSQVSKCEQEAGKFLGYTDMGSAARAIATHCTRAGNVRSST